MGRYEVLRRDIYQLPSADVPPFKFPHWLCASQVEANQSHDAFVMGSPAGLDQAAIVAVFSNM